jgi:hypothetical protein
MVPDHHFMAANPDANWKSVGSIWLGYFRKTLQVVENRMVEAGGVELFHAVENTQVADFVISLIPRTPWFPFTFAQFCTLAVPGDSRR